jgi:molecular chaperone IbpA
MTSYNTVSPYGQFTIGFDSLFNRLESIAKSSSHTSYPPYNIVKSSDDEYVIELALAGLSKDDISIVVQDHVLEISYDGSTDDAGNVEYTHRGISTRKFKKEFELSEYVEVNGASMENGILRILLKKVIPDERKPKVIEIDDGSLDLAMKKPRNTKKLLTE